MLNNFFKIILIVGLLSIASYSKKAKCGLLHLVENHEHLQTIAKKTLSRIVTGGNCQYSQLYNQVYADTTEHFIVFYTLDGPHKLLDWQLGHNSNYLNIVKTELEKSYAFATQSIGFDPPKSVGFSSVFKQEIPVGKYGVEIIDINLGNEITAECGACYGINIPNDFYSTGRSTLVIENDFIYSENPLQSPQDSIIDSTGNTICYYRQPTDTIYDHSNTINYFDNFEYALIPTINHELYHAFQYLYEDFQVAYQGGNFHFWFEASATGYEAITSDYTDYFQYIDEIQEDTHISMLNYNGLRSYGQGVFYQYLTHKYGLTFDLKFWKARAQTYPRNLEKVETTFYKLIENNYQEKFNYSYHQYSQLMSLTGDDYKSDLDVFNVDIKNWAKPRIFKSFYVRDNLTPDELDIDSLAFKIQNIYDIDDYQKYLNWGEFQKDSNYMISIIQVDSSLNTEIIELNDFQNLPKLLNKPTNYMLISRAYSGITNTDQNQNLNEIYAYPNPFRYENQQICFVNSNYDLEAYSRPSLEIYDASGTQVIKISIPLEDEQICWEAKNRSQGKLRAGMYYYRFTQGKNQKLHRFIIID